MSFPAKVCKIAKNLCISYSSISSCNILGWCGMLNNEQLLWTLQMRARKGIGIIKGYVCALRNSDPISCIKNMKKTLAFPVVLIPFQMQK